jgi:hypothetical protein
MIYGNTILSKNASVDDSYMNKFEHTHNILWYHAYLTWVSEVAVDMDHLHTEMAGDVVQQSWWFGQNLEGM